MESVFFTSLTVPELRKMFRDEIESYFEAKFPKPPQDLKHDFLTLPEAADYLRIKRQTLYGYVHRKEIAHSKRGKFLYFKRSDLTDFITTGRRKTGAEITSDAETVMIRANQGGFSSK